MDAADGAVKYGVADEECGNADGDKDGHHKRFSPAASEVAQSYAENEHFGQPTQ